MSKSNHLKNALKALVRVVTSFSAARSILLIFTRRGFFPEALWLRFPVLGTFALSPLDGCSFMYEFTEGDIVGKHLFWRGEYEYSTMEVFYGLAKNADVVLDIGANTGIYTLLACAANSNVRVCAFEPLPQVFRILERNVDINGWRNRCWAKKVAVSNQKARAQFSVLKGGVPTSSSLDPGGFRGQAVNSLLEVSTTTVDLACDEFRKVDLVKIDVEGFEDKVLEGMTSTLSSYHPCVIVECNHDGPYQRVESILREHGYRFFYELRDAGPTLVDTILPETANSGRNYLCTE